MPGFLKYIICSHTPLINGLNQCQAYSSQGSGLLYQRHLLLKDASQTLDS